MENPTTKKENGNAWIKELFDKWESGNSWATTPNQDPDYKINLESGKPLNGLALVVAAEGMHSQNKNGVYVITANQIDEHNNFFGRKKAENPEYKKYRVAFKAKSIGTVLYRKESAYYSQKEIEEAKQALRDHKAGKIKLSKEEMHEKVETASHAPKDHKMNPDGSYVNDLNPSFLFAAEDLRKEVPMVDKDGHYVKYDQDEYAMKNGKPLVYLKDVEYTDKNGEKKVHKKGDPIIKHYKGSIKAMCGEPVITETNQKLPAVITTDMVALPKRKNEYGEQIFVEKMSELLRGKLNGNYEGLKVTKEEIQAMRTAFEGHPKKLMDKFEIAKTYAIGNKDSVDKMENAYEYTVKQNNEKNVAEEPVKKSGRKS